MPANGISVACISGRRTPEVLAELGIWTVLLDDAIPLEVACLVDMPLEIDLEDWDLAERTLRQVHAARPLSAVLSTRESHVALAGFLASRLGVRGPALSAALTCRDKASMRRALEACGVPIPRWAEVGSPSEAEKVAAGIGFPLMAKRRRSSGGTGVRLCPDLGSLAPAIAELGAADDLLLEEYVDGPEFAVQAFTIQGRTEIVNVLRQHAGPPPRLAEIGYDYPCGLDAAQASQVAALVTAALDGLGFDNGVSHSQVRLGPAGPVLIEVNPRPPGGRLGSLTEAVSGVDLVRAAVEVTLGWPVTRQAPAASAALYRCIVFPESGILDYRQATEAGLLPALESRLDPIVELDVYPGDAVLSVDHPDGGVYGRVVVFGDERGQVERDYAAIIRALEIRVDGRTPASAEFPAPTR